MSRWSKMTAEQRLADKERKKRYVEKNREKIAKKKNEHYHKNREKYLELERARLYLKLYKISVLDYDNMFLKQDGKCYICKSPNPGPRQRHFNVDHCHNTGKVRGLLCLSCNTKLGWFEKYQQNIFEYLKGI